MATVNLNMNDLEKTLQDNDIVLIDFWAEWCGPCRVFGPTFEKVSEKTAQKRLQAVAGRQCILRRVDPAVSGATAGGVYDSG